MNAETVASIAGIKGSLMHRAAYQLFNHIIKAYEDSDMPLKKSSSKKAFGDNIRKEYKSLKKQGKSKEKAVKQAVAIAYSVKKKAKKSK